MEARRGGSTSWGKRPFAEVVNDLWARKEGRRRARYITLHQQIEGIGYEGFRVMCDGKQRPRPDIMEQVAAVLGIDSREFPEYRLHQMVETCSRHPEIQESYYDEIMAYAATIERAEKRKGTKKRKQEQEAS